MHKTIALRTVAAAVAAIAFVVPAAAQALLTPGQSVSPLPETFSYPSDYGNVLAQEQLNFTGLDVFGNTVFTGDLLTQVIQDNNTGGLDFAYYIDNNANSVDSIEELAVTDFSGFTTYVASGDPTFSLPMYPHASSAQRSNNGAVIGFNWLNGVGDGAINPGQESRFVMVFTNATQYVNSSASVIDGGVANVGTYGPAAVPEPATYAILGIGVVGLIRRKRRS